MRKREKIGGAMNCTTCHFCREYEEREDAGYCQRYPPVYAVDDAGDTIVTFPVVSSLDWCGEHRPALNS